MLKIIIAMKNDEFQKKYWRIYDELRRRGHTASKSEEKAMIITKKYL